MSIDKIKRRDLLKLLLLPPLLGHNVSATTVGSIQLSPLFKCADERVRKECVAVYEQWMESEPLKPEDYFLSNMKLYGLGLKQASKAVALDFRRGSYFEIKGLMLGKTEASFLAYLGGQWY